MGRTYNAPCFGVICWQVNNGEVVSEQRLISRVPIMVKVGLILFDQYFLDLLLIVNDLVK